MVENHTERDDSALADELNARLDAGKLTPAEDDSPELKALLATYSRLQEAVPEPDPGLPQQLLHAIRRGEGDPGRQEDAKARRRERKVPVGLTRRWLVPAFHTLTILLVAFGFAALRWVDTLPTRVDDQQTILLGQTRFVPDSDASLRVVVQDLGRGEPIGGALVRVSLIPTGSLGIPLFEGWTDETGSLPVQFRVPAGVPGEARLVVETESEVGRDTLEQPVIIQRDYRLLLSSDKPLYQPGQTVHMRALALSSLDQTPARGATVNFLVEDARGNKVFRQSVTASAYGIAAADFQLADLVNQGDYKLSAAIEGPDGVEVRSEKTVEVRPYVLPKFGVEISTERSYYLPAQRVEGVVQADYFFGKPVAGGQVQITGSVWDVERTELLDLRGQTDENGAFAFSFDLPDYFAGSGLESGQAQFALEVTVVDQTDHAEQTGLVLPIAGQPLVIEAVPESGVLKPGVENVVYLLTAYPDGRPAPARLQISVDGQEAVQLASGEYGLAELAFTPERGSDHAFEIVARDEAGLEAQREVDFVTEGGSDSVLLRADRAAYVVGETMNLLVLTPVESGSVYLDIVKAGQTLSTRSALVEDGVARFAVDVSPDLYGSLELHAYKVLLDGTIIRDTRLVVVDAPKELDIAVTADRDSYLPGDAATLDFQITDAQDPEAGVQSALGLAVVDESVFALQQQDPGFAKLYFMLEQELMEPFYQLKGFELPASFPLDQEPVRRAQDQAARAGWAGVPPLTVANLANSRGEKIDAVHVAQREGFDLIGQASAVGLIFIPPLMLLVVVVTWRQAGKRSFGRMVAALAGALQVGVLVTAIFAGATVSLAAFGAETAGLLWLAVPLVIASLVAAGYGWAKRIPLAGFLALVTLAYVGFFFLLIQATDRGGHTPEVLVISACLVFLLMPAAYALYWHGWWARADRKVEQGRRGRLQRLSLAIVVALIPLAILCLLALYVSPTSVFNEYTQPALDSEVPRPFGIESMTTITTAVTFLGGSISDALSYDLSRAEGVTTLRRYLPESPRLRQYFPETLYWAPEVLTDEGGHASLQIPMADSITTWRLTALASSQDGRLGFATRGVRVFQDFFVDIDLPLSLTQGDEISIPIGVYNYLPDAQQVRLVVEPEDWFELAGPGERTLTIAANDVEVVYVPIRVRKFGRQGFQVTAWGERMSDAIRREVTVLPNGQAFHQSQSDWLRESKRVPVEVPAAAVPGATSVEVKIYPGAMAQVVEGLEKILRLPHG